MMAGRAPIASAQNPLGAVMLCPDQTIITIETAARFVMLPIAATCGLRLA